MARKYFYDTGEQKVGPVTGNQLVQLRASGQINDNTWVRRENSSTWRPLGSVNLREEEEQEANPSLWRLLTRNFTWQSLLLFGAVVIIFVAVGIGLLAFAWPIVLVLLFLWLLNRMSKP